MTNGFRLSAFIDKPYVTMANFALQENILLSNAPVSVLEDAEKDSDKDVLIQRVYFGFSSFVPTGNKQPQSRVSIHSTLRQTSLQTRLQNDCAFLSKFSLAHRAQFL
jgi:hypothetical protein